MAPSEPLSDSEDEDEDEVDDFESENEDEVEELLRDLYPNAKGGGDTHTGFDDKLEEDPNTEAGKFYSLMEDFEQPLYQNSKASKLSSLIKFLHIKIEPRNIRLGLASDGFQPFQNSKTSIAFGLECPEGSIAEGYLANECMTLCSRFHAEDYDRSLRTQNCGIIVASKNDEDNEMFDYYGVLPNVIEFQFVPDRRVILFRCNWFTMKTENEDGSTIKSIMRYTFCAPGAIEKRRGRGLRSLITKGKTLTKSSLSLVYQLNDVVKKYIQEGETSAIGKGPAEGFTNSTMCSSQLHREPKGGLSVVVVLLYCVICVHRLGNLQTYNLPDITTNVNLPDITTNVNFPQLVPFVLPISINSSIPSDLSNFSTLSQSSELSTFLQSRELSKLYLALLNNTTSISLVNQYQFSLSVQLISSIEWEEFASAILDRFFPLELREAKVLEFINLRQGIMIVKEYSPRFTQLARYASHVVADSKAKMSKFMSGVTDSVGGNRSQHSQKFSAPVSFSASAPTPKSRNDRHDKAPGSEA
ncbi:hypothetical protein FXO37_21350 [Capsicum annuum]|nr:hypothetical protein FXO37_21350 [Capsicum annuum]